MNKLILIQLSNHSTQHDLYIYIYIYFKLWYTILYNKKKKIILMISRGACPILKIGKLKAKVARPCGVYQ